MATIADGVLARIAYHEVGLPVVDDGFHCREHCLRREAAEELAIAENGRLEGWCDRKLFADRSNRLLGRLAACCEGMAGLSHQAGERRRGDHQHLVALPASGFEQGKQWLEMTCTPERARGEYPHLGSSYFFVLDV